MIIKTSQLNELRAGMQQEYVEAMLDHFRPMNMPFLPLHDAEARIYLQQKVLEARRFRLLTGKSCERYIYLCLSYPLLNERIHPPALADNLSWPDRSEEDKLEVLYRMLTGLMH